MSATQDFVRKQNTGDPLTKLVLRVIADYANWETGQCFPSIQTLASDCECSERTVQRRLQELAELGFITVELKAGHTHVITLVGYQQWFEKLPVRTFERGDCQLGVTVSPKGVTAGHERGDCGTPEIYNNKYLNNINKKNDNRITNCYEEETRVFFHNEQIKLCDSLNQFWLQQFEGQKDCLDLALLQISAYVQPNNIHGLEKQVSSQLARIVRDRKDKDKRYAAAAKSKPINGKPNFQASKTDDSLDRANQKFWDRVEKGEIKL